jgi:hypothetical protein
VIDAAARARKFARLGFVVLLKDVDIVAHGLFKTAVSGA